MSNPFQEILDLQESIKKGDSVHVGHKTPGGSGVRGKVEKIEDDKVYIRHDNGNLYKGLLKNTTKLNPTKEEVDLEEKKLTPAELKKREEIAKAMERDNPGMDMSKKIAIATAVAKRVAESKEEKKEDEVPFSGPYKKEPTKNSAYRLVRKLARKYQKEHPVKEETELEDLTEEEFAKAVVEMNFNPTSLITSPVSPLNPGGPLWVGNALKINGASGGTVSPETMKVLFNILTGLVSGAVAVGAKLAADNFMNKASKLVKGKLKIDSSELKAIQSQIKTIYDKLGKTKNPEIKAKYEAMLKDAYLALEEIKSRLDMKAKGAVA